MKDECLDRMIFVGPGSLCRALAEYMEHCHSERNHQGENRLILPRAMEAKGGAILRHARLGGTLNFYTARPRMRSVGNVDRMGLLGRTGFRFPCPPIRVRIGNARRRLKRSLERSDRRFKSGHAYALRADGLQRYRCVSRQLRMAVRIQGVYFSGTRHGYTVLAPIVDPANHTLFMNLFPIAGSPTIALVETDQRFFAWRWA